MGESLSKYIYHPPEKELEHIIEAQLYTERLIEVLPVIRIDMELRQQLITRLNRLKLALGVRHVQLGK